MLKYQKYSLATLIGHQPAPAHWATFFIWVLLFCFSWTPNYSTAQEMTGQEISELHCSRCHVVDDDKPFTGISSTPSFSLMVNRLSNWEDRFNTFFARRPHPAFLILEGSENPLVKEPATVPIELRLNDVEKIVEFARTLKNDETYE